MFYYKETLEDIESRYVAEVKTAMFANNLDPKDVSFVSGNNVYMLTDLKYSDFTAKLSKCRRLIGKLTLRSYYPATDNGLAIKYVNDSTKVNIVFFCSDIERTLKKVSGGKCSIVEKQYTASQVVCEVGA